MALEEAPLQIIIVVQSVSQQVCNEGGELGERCGTWVEQHEGNAFNLDLVGASKLDEAMDGTAKESAVAQRHFEEWRIEEAPAVFVVIRPAQIEPDLRL